MFADAITNADDCANGPPLHGYVLSRGRYTAYDFPGAVSTEMFGLNEEGVIVGDYDDASGQTHGFTAVPKETD